MKWIANKCNCECRTGCCGCYSVALILSGPPVDFFLQYTTGGHTIVASHGKWAGSPISDPATPGCDTRVIWFPCVSPADPCDDTYAALQTEFGTECVTNFGYSYFGLPPWAYGDSPPQPENYPNWGPLDCTATGGLIVGLYASAGDITGASARVYKACNSCSLVGTIEFPTIPEGTDVRMTVPQSCCCKCCDAYSLGGLIGYFAEWDCVSDCVYVDGVSPACCADYCEQTKRVKIQPSPYAGDIFGGAEGSCQWIDDEGYFHLYGGLPDFNYQLGGICDLGDGVWTRDSNFEFGCRTGPTDNGDAVIPFGPVGYCGTGSVTCTPIVESWTSCYDPIPDLTVMPFRAMSAPAKKCGSCKQGNRKVTPRRGQ